MTILPSIRIEGGLLGPDVLEQLLSADLPGQRPADFGLEGRRSITDEVAAIFADARALWQVVQHRLQRLPETDIATSVTRDAWMIPFLSLLGYELKYNPRAIEVDGLTYAISHRAGESEESPPVHIVGMRQELGRVPASGRPRLAPHSLVQEFLNRTDHVWGIVTNGLSLRLLRDSTFVRRQAYVEFDLQVIIEEQHFQDFAALYRLLHRSRLPKRMEDGSECLLEKYYVHSVEQGGRVREHLRDGVEECITGLANGFLRHKANEELRKRVSTSAASTELISADMFYRQLLRLVYRFLFLLVSEDRGLLSSDPIYIEHYGIARVRRLLDQRAAYTDDDDIWQSLRVLWHVFGKEQWADILSLAPLNGELFALQSLDEFTITNRDLLDAIWHLTWYKEERSGSSRRVNYAALDVEELGSVYESLLELHPTIEQDSVGRFHFYFVKGTGRKETGSFYTPPQLVNELVHSALDPVISDRLNGAKSKDQKRKAILSIKVCDPACGSGHFLLAAARHMGKELARVSTEEDEPAPERVREAIREVISHCIYGVDKNPLAVDLCRVALWLESHTGNKPLTFLDHRILCGDSLVGVFDLEILKDGIPDKAFDPLEGDNKTIAREAAKRNRKERGGIRSFFDWNPSSTLDELTRHSREIDSITDDTPDAIQRKKQLFEQSHDEPVWQRHKEASDLWTAAFFQALTADSQIITSDALAGHLAGQLIKPQLKAQALSISTRERFFHWPLEFPEVFAEDGFDVILSNPPWEHVELKEQEFFAARDARIAAAPTKAARVTMIKELSKTNPVLHREFIAELRSIDASRLFMATGGRYPLTGRGRINTYAVFSELCKHVIRLGGRAGIIVPSGIATDDTTKFFFQDLIQSKSLVSLFDFENRKKIFQAIDSRMKFCLLTLQHGSNGSPASAADFVFFALDVDDLRKAEKRFSLSAEEISLLNPNTGNCPIFRTKADAELTKAIYRRVPVLWREASGKKPEVNSWMLRFSQGLFNMSSDSHHFRAAEALEAEDYSREGNVFVGPKDRYLPLYEAKMLHQFDHRWATYENTSERDVTLEEKRDPAFVVQPRYWVREEVVESAIPAFTDSEGHLTSPKWFLGWRDVTNATNERTLIVSVVPRTAVGHKFMLMFPMAGALDKLCLEGMFNSLAVDYCARQKIGGTSFSYFIIRQLPVFHPGVLMRQSVEGSNVMLLNWLAPRVLELVYTAHDLTPLAQDCGYDGPPFSWDEDRRFEIRCELDAAFFHLYLPSGPTGDWRSAEGETQEQLSALKGHFPTPRDAMAYILDQFPIVKQKDEQAHGRYRTKDRILEIYDAMLAAQRSLQPYQTKLNPPPGVRT